MMLMHYDTTTMPNGNVLHIMCSDATKPSSACVLHQSTCSMTRCCTMVIIMSCYHYVRHACTILASGGGGKRIDAFSLPYLRLGPEASTTCMHGQR